MNMTQDKIAFVFPGQGSQFVGMGQDLYDVYPEVRAVFEEADQVLGFHLSRLCFQGPENLLNDTINAQPAIIAVSFACLRVLEERKGKISLSPAMVAGHSLGEYTALLAAGCLGFAEALKLGRERGRVMREAGQRIPGGMAAVIGLPDEILEEVCQEASRGRETVQVANFNSPGQTVISGERKALERAMNLAKREGGRRVIPLPVSIAGHSLLMEPAAERFAKLIAQQDFREAQIPLVANVSAQPIRAAADMKAELVKQLTSPVQWVRSIQHMIRAGIETFVEIGPKKVLSGLIKRINGQVKTISLGDVPSFESLLVGEKGYGSIWKGGDSYR